MKRLYTLDGLRGIFALLVLLFHAQNNTAITNNFFIRNADLFVDYFFVLSGFVISYNYLHNLDLKTFLRKRFFRLYPLLLYTVTIFAILLIAGSVAGMINTKENIFLISLDSLTFMNSTPVFGSSLGANYPSWSISAEMISYIVFALVVVFSGKHRRIIFPLILLIAAAFFAYTQHYDHRGGFGFVRGLYCFIIGYYVYIASKYTASMGTAHEIAVVVVLLLGLHEADSQLVKAVFPFIFGASIWVIAQSTGIVSRLLKTATSKFLGKISYSLYLNHAIVLIIVEKTIFNIFNLDQKSVPVNIAYLSTAIALTIVYSYFTHKYIERAFNPVKVKLVSIQPKTRANSQVPL